MARTDEAGRKIRADVVGLIVGRDRDAFKSHRSWLGKDLHLV